MTGAMTRVALDSNILIYAELEPQSNKGRQAADLILQAARDGVIPVQVLGEYLRFVPRRAPAVFEDAIRQASIYRAAFLTPPTTDAVIDKASELARAHRMQLWDGVVCAASIDAGAKVLMTEDMQDGRVIDGLRLLNPFAQANAEAIKAMWGD
jgi:predicted nucleic acid-binding protein